MRIASSTLRSYCGHPVASPIGARTGISCASVNLQELDICNHAGEATKFWCLYSKTEQLLVLSPADQLRAPTNCTALVPDRRGVAHPAHTSLCLPASLAGDDR
jgi:hypothetical protein